MHLLRSDTFFNNKNEILYQFNKFKAYEIPLKILIKYINIA